ncbi:MAG: C10 family peptidase [Bacteroidales bacterium]
MKIQLSNSEQSPEAEILWNHVQQSIIDEVTSHKAVPPDDCYDHTEIYTCGPLGIPTWHQNAPYKGDLPYINCNGSQFQVKVGCMPLAMAAVMRYHEHPTSYNWSQMYYGYSTSTTEAIIADIHDEINSEYPALPVYTCTGTGVGGDMSWVLKNNFDYSNAILANYNYQTVVNNIAYDRPVILTGEDPTYGKHSWVCSGYRWYTYYNADCTATSSLHFYMYWGYENAANNGWYSEGNFNPGVYSYNNNKTMIYNIIP